MNMDSSSDSFSSGLSFNMRRWLTFYRPNFSVSFFAVMEVKPQISFLYKQS